MKPVKPYHLNTLLLLAAVIRSSSFTTKAPIQLSLHHSLQYSGTCPKSICKQSLHQSLFQSNGNNDDGEDKSFGEKFDSLLDRQFFDPDKIIQTEEERGDAGGSNPLLWFANLVKNDYEKAEALFATGFLSILVILTQELLRMVKYGDAYTPFTKIGSGTLF